MDNKLNAPWVALRLGIGLTATLAGLDKFLNLLADWGSYVSPVAAEMLPISVPTFMGIVGIIELAVGFMILSGWTRIGAYIASAWLIGVAANLALAGYFDVAVRDVVMSIGAFTLARLTEARERSLVGGSSIGDHMRRPLTAALLLAALLPVGLSAAPVASEPITPAELNQTMRRLWSDHVFWTRQYIVAAIAGDASAGAAADRLLRNQEDIGNAVAGFYGDAAGQGLTTLLKEHITIAVDLIKFAKSGDKATYAKTDSAWQQNGVDIAEFLSKANPHWPKAALAEAMKAHLSTTTTMVVARLTQDWEGDARAFDAVYDHILHMADTLATGIVKQFPDHFSK